MQKTLGKYRLFEGPIERLVMMIAAAIIIGLLTTALRFGDWAIGDKPHCDTRDWRNDKRSTVDTTSSVRSLLSIERA